MSSINKLKLTSIFLLIFVLIYLILYAADGGLFKTITPQFSGNCQPIKGTIGAEDIHVDRTNLVAYISAHDRRSTNLPTTANLYRYDLNSEHQPVALLNSPPADFRPHGLYLYQQDTKSYLYVVNHPDNAETIESYEIVDQQLVYRKTFKSPLINSPNDLVVVALDKFYVTNDHGFNSGWLRTIEDYLRLKLGNVVYFDGSQYQSVASGISYANGINVSNDGKNLYVASPSRGEIHVFARDIESGLLTEQQVIDTGTGIDNIQIDEQDNLWMGAHANVFAFLAHARSPANGSPSEVLKITRPIDDENYQIEQIYLNDGSPMSGSSVAEPIGNRLLIGSVFEPVFLDCTINNN